MTAFLWTVVILMVAALLAEVIAFVGMAVVAMRAGRRTAEITEQLKRAVEPTVQLANELKQTLQPRLETITNEREQIAELVSTRTDAVRAILDDTNRRAERVRLRLLEGVESVNGLPGRRGIYREIAGPIKTAGHVVRGLKIALWILRRVA